MESSQAIRLGVHGACGRMGKRVIQLASEDPGIVLAAALDQPGAAQIGQDAGVLAGIESAGVALTAAIEEGAALDVVIDFSVPQAALAIARQCARRGVPLVVGTTGLEPAARQELEALAAEIPLFIASNFDRAVHLLMRLTAIAARELGPSADIEIIERHHHFKKDAPSGTALSLAEAAGRALHSSSVVHGRHGVVGERPRGEIGIHALRTGDNPGEHTVVFGLMGECIELTHRALNRDGFARGALDAARFLAGKPARLYGMSDLLHPDQAG